jgi:hypothetical protein
VYDAGVRAVAVVLLVVGAAARVWAGPPPVSTTESRAEAERACAAHEAGCDWLATFSSLERASLERALAARGYTIEPQPWGKVIARVDVYNEDVFAEKNWLQFFNFIHYTTRENAIRNELTIGQGDVWDPDRIAESARRLHDPLYSSVVALVPVKSTVPNEVDLLVVTRDVWSLRLNSNYTFQQGSLTYLGLILSENNFLGLRDVVGLAVVMDQATVSVGPTFIDKNLLGKHLQFQFSVNDIFTRRAPLVFSPAKQDFVPVAGDPHGLQDGGGFHSEGHNASVSLFRPLWSLASKWGGGASFADSDSVVRSFTGAAPTPTIDGNPNALYLDPGTGLPYEFRLESWSVNPYVTRQWGSRLKQQLTLGYTVSDVRPSLLPSFAGDAAEAAQFAADVFPRSELVSQPYLDFTVFTPRYETVRNVSTYALAEDLQLGPSIDLSYGQGLRALGGDYTFEHPALSVGWTFPWCRDGFIAPQASISLRFQDRAVHGHSSVDDTAHAQLRVATPTLGRVGRVVAQLAFDTLWHDTQNQFYTIGSDSGLRGYGLNQFRVQGGGRRLSSEVELRTLPVAIWVFRVGAVGFYEAGGVAASLGEMAIYQDIGVGLRALIPQTSRELFRFDLAFPLVAAPGTPVGSPHFIAGYASYF